MALAQSIKAPKKAPPKKRDPLFADEKHTGREPVWDTEKALAMTQEEFDHHLRKSFFYYNYYFVQKDLKKHAVAWMQEQKYSKSDLSAFIRSHDRAVSMTAYSLLMAHKQGMPFREKELAFFKKQIDTAINAADAEPVETTTGPKTAVPVPVAKPPTIQDRLNEKTSEHLAYFEGLYDEVVAGGTVDPKAYDYLVSSAVPQSQIKKFEDLFMARKTELGLAVGRADEQIVEAYRHYKTSDYKRHHAFLQAVLDALEQYRSVKKATKKAKVKRAPNKEKVVSKIKYMKEDKTLKLVSVNPVDIIGAQELWVFNTKTRKLGQYIASTSAGLAVKGTSIENYTDKSVSKTLRKPDVQLAEFMKAGKVQLRKFMESIKATDTLLNGRINSDTILLKVQ